MKKTTKYQTQIQIPRFKEENGFYTTKERSKIMSKIKGKDTKPEIRLRKALWKIGIRYRKNVKDLPGCPDIVIVKYKLILFIDGEFWHGHNWQEKKPRIKSNRKFWIPKIERNIERDKINTCLLEAEGWKVLRLWESEILRDFEKCLNGIMHYIYDTY